MNTIVIDPTPVGERPTLGSPLCAATDYFMRTYNSRLDLVAEQREWSRRITIHALDTGESVTIGVVEGRLERDYDISTPSDVVISSDSTTLCNVFNLRIGPNEPYLFGELTVRGPEADFLRIDYIAAALCPE